jgi:hypothetical protein
MIVIARHNEYALLSIQVRSAGTRVLHRCLRACASKSAQRAVKHPSLSRTRIRVRAPPREPEKKRRTSIRVQVVARPGAIVMWGHPGVETRHLGALHAITKSNARMRMHPGALSAPGCADMHSLEGSTGSADADRRM